jgi:hypothetical protein
MEEMMLKRIETRVSQIEARVRAVAAWLRSPRALRLVARARRNPNALLAALLGIGILLMVLHWWGQPLRASAHAGAGAAAIRTEATVGHPHPEPLSEATVAAGH